MANLLRLDKRRPVNKNHPLNRGLTAWWLCAPGEVGANVWHDLCRTSDLAVTGLLSGHGFQQTGPALRPGGWAALDLNASSAGTAVASSSSPALNAWTTQTIMFWARLTTNIQNGRLIEKGANNEWTIAQGDTSHGSTGGVELQIGSTTACAGSNNVMTDSLWHHYVATISSSFVGTLYVDGRKQTISNTGTTPGAKTHALTVGQFSGGGGFGLVGQIDDVRVHNALFTGTEVLAAFRLSSQGWPGALNRGQARPRAGFTISSTVFNRTLYDRAGSRGVA